MSEISKTLLNTLDRRAFLQAASLPCLAVCSGALVGTPLAPSLFATPPATEDESQFIREAKFYEKLPYKRLGASSARANA